MKIDCDYRDQESDRPCISQAAWHAWHQWGPDSDDVTMIAACAAHLGYLLGDGLYQVCAIHQVASEA